MNTNDLRLKGLKELAEREREDQTIDDPYINLTDFEDFVRDRFKNIINGKGLVIPRIAIKLALDDIFESQNERGEV